MRKTWSLLLMLWFAMLLLPGAARAQEVLFSTFGPNFSYELPIGYIPFYSASVVEAVAFTLPRGSFTGSYAFSRLDLAILDLANTSPPPYVFQVQLNADASGVPGTVLETWTVSSPTPNPLAGVFTVYDAQHLELVAERQYWVTVGSVGPFAGGYWNATSQSGVACQHRLLSETSGIFPTI